MPALLLVEDNVLLANTMSQFLRDRGKLEVLAVAPTAEIALERLSQLKVDLLLVDVSLPGISGIELVAMVSKLYPELPCLVLSGHDELDYIRRALAAGARGYVIKSAPQQILMAVQQVLNGEIYLDAELQKKLYH